MKPFKFFQKPVKGDLTMFDGQTRATASFVPDELPALTDWDTPQGHNTRRRLYHTNHPEYERQRQIREELRTRLREHGVTELERVRIRQEADERLRQEAYQITQEELRRTRVERFESMRRTNDDMERYFIGRDLNDNRIESTPAPEPNWYQRLMKLKNWFNDMYGVVIYVAMVLTFLILLFTVI